MKNSFHTPALLKEAVDALNVRPNGKYIDATIGGGGHAAEIIQRGGRVLGIDQDQDAIDYIRATRKESIGKNRLIPVQGNFADIARIAREREFEHADGILFDLGVSSYQIGESGRGFSFLRDEPLDMRMSRELALTAYEIINKASVDELYDIFSKFGEEKNARAISNAVVRARRVKPIERSRELAEIVTGVAGSRDKIHPATRVFQALRIAVNSEIDNLRTGLSGAFEILAPGGRLAVISFHSLEDRVAKLFFIRLARQGAANLKTRKPIIPSIEEMRTNRRARSAKLRVIEKI